MAGEPKDRVRTLLLRGDNLLKSGNPDRLDRAVAAFAEAQEVAKDPSVDDDVRELVKRRLDSIRALIESQG
jgi:hypothetical protein